jgi:hypothetical protein
MRYPQHLGKQQTLFESHFDPGIDGTVIETFSDENFEELTIWISLNGSEGYMINDNPSGVSYRFDQDAKRWRSSLGESTGNEPRVVDGQAEIYVHKSGDGVCTWSRAIAFHPKQDYTLELVYTRCIDELRFNVIDRHAPDIGELLENFKFLKG